MKALGGGGENSSSSLSLTSALDEGRWLTRPGRHAPDALTQGNRPGTHCAGGWMSHRAGLEGWWKSRAQGNSIPYRKDRSESLYRLSYSGLQLYLVAISSVRPGFTPCTTYVWIVTPQRQALIDLSSSSSSSLQSWTSLLNAIVTCA